MCFWNDKELAKHLIREDPCMTMALFVRLLGEVAAHSGSISLTDWGEFLSDPLRDERLKVLGDFLRAHPELPYEQITNGSMLRTENLSFLQDVKRVTFSISLDSVDTLEYAATRRPGTLPPVLKNIHHLRARLLALGVTYVTIILRVVLMKRNLFSLAEVVRFAQSIGATVYCDHVCKYFNNDMEAESLLHFPVLSNFVIESTRQLACKLNVPFDAPAPIAPSIEVANSPSSAISTNCYQIETSGPIHVDTNGDVTPCCQPLIIGNVNRQSFSEIVTGEEINRYRNAIATGQPLPPCDHCQYLRRGSKYICDSRDYGWDILPESRCYERDPNLVKGGFFKWIKEIPEPRLRHLLREHYQFRAGELLETNLREDSTSMAMKRLTLANDRILQLLKKKGNSLRVVIYGAGADTLWLFKYSMLDELPVVAIADRDEAKQGGVLFNCPIISPAQISEYEADVVLISSLRHGGQIRQQLAQRFPDMPIVNLL
jgi:radical SAM protein with 4Fe4S-binding SPASM domain